MWIQTRFFCALQVVILLMVHKSGVHQLRLVVYPIVYRVFMDFIHPNGGWPWDF